MQQSDHDYFARRAREERVAAERADSAEARRSHLELAHRYEAAAAAAAGLPVVQLKVGGKRAAG
ncbi:MAG: hypothetical protein HOP95_12250 [Sphingomonas sp.]|nr:hypothetical protein [Sphingomonas sp.]